MFRGSHTPTPFVPLCGLAFLGLTLVGCDKMPLLAPTNSTVSVTSAASVLSAGGSAEVSAFVAESGGTPVQNGTVVRFTTTLGRVDPVEATTRNGLATTMFHAGDVSGVADVRATSGAIGGTGSTGTGTTTASNAVQITIGAAAVETIVVRANPASVDATGGNSELVASVVGAGGRALAGVPVTFSATEGQLTNGRVPTDEFGESRTTLVLGRIPAASGGTRPTARVTAAAGVKSAEVTVTWRDALPTPSVTLAAVAETASTIGHRWTFTATVTGTDTTSQPVKYEWEFGNGATATTSGNSTAYVYTGGDRGRVQQVTVRVTLANGQTITAVTSIIVLA